MENKNIEPLISVVIPYYNDGAYIEETVNSILNQTYKNTEISIVNDGSTDILSIEKLAHFDNEKVRIINQINKGLSSARNVGFEQANSEYVLTIDSDDMFEETFLEKAVKILQDNSKIGAVSSWVSYINEQGEYLNNQWKPKGGKLQNFLVENNSVACALIRRKLWEQLGGYDENMKDGYEDWNFWIQLTNLEYEVYIIKESLFLYRQKGSSMLQNSLKKHFQLQKAIVFNNDEIFKEHRHLLNEYLFSQIEFYKKNHNVIQENIDLKKEFLSIQNSKSYKIGRVITSPLRTISRLFYSKRS